MFNTIRIQLSLWFTGVLALVLLAFAFSAYEFLDYTITRQTDRTLRELSNTLTDAIDSEQNNQENKTEPSETAVNNIREAMEDLRFRNYQIFVFDSSAKAISINNKLPREESLNTEQISGLVTDFSNSSRASQFYNLPGGKDDFRIFARRQTAQGQDFLIFVTHSLEEEDEILERFRNILLITIPVALLLASFGGYFLARKSLSPVVSMSYSASNISATNLHERLPVKNERDELGNLATVFNSLLDRLENSFDQQRRFMADASHELRTPLAIVQGESEVALSKKDRPQDELRESLEIVHDESKRLTKIVEDLFTLARADANQFKTNFKDIYLDEVLVDCVRKMRVLAERENISIDCSADEAMISGDEPLLRRLFVNLLDNAIKYNRNGGSVSIIGEKQPNGYRIMISDTGSGILPAEQVKIFERFYRSDKARTRRNETETSGAGLGLSIANWIATLHQTKIELYSSDTSGSTFSIIFPNSV